MIIVAAYIFICSYGTFRSDDTSLHHVRRTLVREFLRNPPPRLLAGFDDVVLTEQHTRANDGNNVRAFGYRAESMTRPHGAAEYGRPVVSPYGVTRSKKFTWRRHNIILRSSARDRILTSSTVSRHTHTVREVTVGIYDAARSHVVYIRGPTAESSVTRRRCIRAFLYSPCWRRGRTGGRVGGNRQDSRPQWDANVSRKKHCPAARANVCLGVTCCIGFSLDIIFLFLNIYYINILHTRGRSIDCNNIIVRDKTRRRVITGQRVQSNLPLSMCTPPIVLL